VITRRSSLAPSRATLGRGVWCCVVVLVAIGIAGCESESLIGSNFTPPTLANAEYKWKSARLTEYSFVSTVSCFCLDAFYGPLRVTVRAGRVASVVNTRTGVPVPLAYRQPIDSLFPLMRREIRENPEFFGARYDDRLGYPRVLQFGNQAIDAGATITIDSLVALAR
jgi:hypothetical protein